jgi:hypothetical protein
MASVDPESDTSKQGLPRVWLIGYIRLVGVSALFAFLAAFMPAEWIVKITDELQLREFPEMPVAFYLARHLSLMYGFVGIALLYFTAHFDRFRDLVGLLAIAVMAFGGLQGLLDFQSNMPIWWTLGESISTVIGGAIMFWLHRCTE